MKNSPKSSDSTTSSALPDSFAARNVPARLPAGGKFMTSSAPSAELLQGLIDSFGAVWIDFGRNLLQAAAIVKRVVDLATDGLDRLLIRYPDISRRTFERLYAVGSGKILPALALDLSYGATLASRLPVAQQERLLSEGVKVAKADGSVERKPLKDLSVREAMRVFRLDGAGIRSIEEQRDLREQVAAPRPRYEIDAEAGTIYFEHATLTIGQLEAVLTMAKEEVLKRLPQHITKRSGKAI